MLGIVLNQKHNTDVRVNPKKIRFNFPLIGEIYSIGFPSIFVTAIGSVTTYLMNQILLAVQHHRVGGLRRLLQAQQLFLYAALRPQ